MDDVQSSSRLAMRISAAPELPVLPPPDAEPPRSCCGEILTSQPAVYRDRFARIVTAIVWDCPVCRFVTYRIADQAPAPRPAGTMREV